MKIKGFTLIELLAVIVILAIIALIAVPIVLNIINNASKSAFRNTAYGIIKAGELYYSKTLLDLETLEEDLTFTFPNAEGLEIDGEKPSSGTMIITKDGKVALAASNGKYCARKESYESEITITEGTCNDTTLLYEIGDTVYFDPGDGESTAWYVINDNGSEVTLLLNKNLGDTIEWINVEDYVEANKDDNTVCEYEVCNDEGPLTALKYLNSQTTDWDNITSFTYVLENDNTDGEIYYPPITVTDAKARFLTDSEIGAINSHYLKKLNSHISEEDMIEYIETNFEEINTLIGEILEKEVSFTTVEEIFEEFKVPYSYGALFELVSLGVLYGIEAEFSIEYDLNKILPDIYWLFVNLDKYDTTDLPKGYWVSSVTNTTEEYGSIMNYKNPLASTIEFANESETIGIRPVITISKEKLKNFVFADEITLSSSDVSMIVGDKKI